MTVPYDLQPYSLTDFDGETSLEDVDIEGLIPTFVATRGDLNTVEAENILRASPWAVQQVERLGSIGILQFGFFFELHKRMFCDVWDWAGSQRTREANLGSDPAQIVEDVKRTMDDAIYWHENNTFDADGRAVRLHHRLVTVHPFRNGNGWCTRLIGDLYLMSVGSTPFTWGGGSAEIRPKYIDAVRAAPDDGYVALSALSRQPVPD